MKPDSALDHAVFHLSPKRSRCELLVSSDGNTEKVASGLLKPFAAHLKVVEEKVAATARSVRLEVGPRQKAQAWFTKGTLERFVRFVSTPEVLELVNTFDAEMSQLEAARRIYSQGAGDYLSGAGGGSGATAANDSTKNELLRAIDVRLVAVGQDLISACSRATAAGFNIDTVSELQMFADRFGAQRLNEACSNFVSVCHRRPDLTNRKKSESNDVAVRSSYGSDMSIDDDPPSPPPPSKTHQQDSATCHQIDSSIDRDCRNKLNNTIVVKVRKDETSIPDQTQSIKASQPSSRLSVLERISMFENKQKENSDVVKSIDLKRLSSGGSSSSVLRRWSGASDMSIELSSDKQSLSEPERKRDTSTSCSGEMDIKVVHSLDASMNECEARYEPFKLKFKPGSGERDYLKDQVSSSISRVRGQINREGKFKYVEQVEILNQREDSESRDQSDKRSGGLRIQEAFAARLKGIEGDCISSSGQQVVRSAGKDKVTEKIESSSSEKVASSSISSVEDSGTQKLKLIRQDSALEQIKEVQNQTDENIFLGGNVTTLFSGKSVDYLSTPPPGQAQRLRQSKGNQELNDELKMKANDLEKLFAQHKLRVPRAQFNLGRKSGSASSLFDGDSISKDFSELSVSTFSRGKFYERYMQKRDAKLREEWSSNRAEKEARLKCLQDSLERSKSEMKIKFSYNSSPIVKKGSI